MKKVIPIILVISSFILVSSVIDLNDLMDYESQTAPNYISKDNTPTNNPISNKGATLGRILFYDKNLSADNSTSCASCHIQEFAFGDTAVVSKGLNGVTGRHSMRLVNARFSDEVKFFWDERASSLEDQSTKPIQDHVEMGFSGSNGDPNIDSLCRKLENIQYYNDLFELVYGDTEVAEYRIQQALAQFIRSIQSFDSKYDTGRAQVSSIVDDFPNFTTQENEGKNLFMSMPPMGGAGCARCHSGDEFTIISNTENNGVIGVAGDTSAIDLTNTKAPSLRNLVNNEGALNGPYMHDGSLKTLMDVVDHYNDLVETAENTNLDFRLAGAMHDLNLTLAQRESIVAFLKTLTGHDVYTNEKYSNPFDSVGNITVIPNTSIGIKENVNMTFDVYPTLVKDNFNINIESGEYMLDIFTTLGKKVYSSKIQNTRSINISKFEKGIYIVRVINLKNKFISSERIIKE